MPRTSSLASSPVDATRALEEAIAAAAQQFASSVARALVAQAGSRDWVSQYDSPLGRRAHLAAVRRGDLRGCKVGKRVLVCRDALDAFILARALVPAKASTDGAEAEERSLRAFGVSPSAAASMMRRRSKG